MTKRKDLLPTVLAGIVLGIAVGIATAPLGVPLARSICFGAAFDPKPLLDAMSPQFILGYAWESVTSPSTTPAFLLWLATMIAVSAPALVARDLDSPMRDVDGGILGDSRLIGDEREILARNDSWDGQGEPMGCGLVIGSSEGGYVFDSSVPHWMVVGKTGSGKSWLMVLQTLHLSMARGINLVVTGKSELLELTGEKAVELGYRRVVFDLAGCPGASRFNPLNLVAEYAEAGEVNKAQRTARQVAADLIPMSGGNEYFPRAARSLLTACLLIVAFADAPREQKGMAAVCDLVNRGTTGEGKDPSAPLKDYIHGPEVGPGHPAFAPAADFLSDGGKTVAGKNVLSSLKEALSVFNDEGLSWLTSASDVPIRSLVRDKSIVYMHLLEEGDPYLVLMTCFLNQWWRVAQEEAAGNAGRLPHETAIVGDEWGNLPRVDAMPEIVTLGRSYGLHAWCFTQDLKQWNKYGTPGDQNAGRDKILGSMGGKVALSLASPDDFSYFTRLAGKRTIRTRNVGTSRHGAGMAATSGSSEGFSEQAVDLIKEWEWQSRVASRDGLVCIKGGENSKPGREGVFQVPVTYASMTPAARFFGLGDEDECAMRRMAFRKSMEKDAQTADDAIDFWQAPLEDEDPVTPEEAQQEEIAEDECSAWDVDL